MSYDNMKGLLPHVSMYINEISKLFFDRMRIEGEKIGVSQGYNKVLFHLTREDGLTQNELVQRTHFKPSTISVTLQKMEFESLVIRKHDNDDLRQTKVYLTDKGRKLDSEIRRNIDETEEILLAGFNAEDIEDIKIKLDRMRSNILNGSDIRYED